MSKEELDKLSEIARDKKTAFKEAQFRGESQDTLKALCNEYGKAMANWYEARYPGKKAPKVSLTTMMRM